MGRDYVSEHHSDCVKVLELWNECREEVWRIYRNRAPNCHPYLHEIEALVRQWQLVQRSLVDPITPVPRPQLAPDLQENCEEFEDTQSEDWYSEQESGEWRRRESPGYIELYHRMPERLAGYMSRLRHSPHGVHLNCVANRFSNFSSGVAIPRQSHKWARTAGNRRRRNRG